RLAPVPPGTYGVTATAAGHTAGFILGVVVTPKASARADVKLGGDAITVSGTIVDDQTDRPVKGTTITLARYSDVDGDVFAVDVNEGTFRVQLPRGRYGLFVRAPGHGEEWRNVGETPAGMTVRLLRTSPPGPAPATVVDWLRTHAIPLSTVE